MQFVSSRTSYGWQRNGGIGPAPLGQVKHALDPALRHGNEDHFVELLDAGERAPAIARYGQRKWSRRNLDQSDLLSGRDVREPHARLELQVVDQSSAIRCDGDA